MEMLAAIIFIGIVIYLSPIAIMMVWGLLVAMFFKLGELFIYLRKHIWKIIGAYFTLSIVGVFVFLVF